MNQETRVANEPKKMMSWNLVSVSVQDDMKSIGRLFAAYIVRTIWNNNNEVKSNGFKQSERNIIG